MISVGVNENSMTFSYTFEIGVQEKKLEGIFFSFLKCLTKSKCQQQQKIVVKMFFVDLLKSKTPKS